MKLHISYTTTERKYHPRGGYHHLIKTIQINPISINRIPLCWEGAKPQRYSYRAVYYAPLDAVFKNPDGTYTANIVRVNNPHFNPKKLVFINNICILDDATKGTK